MRIPYSFQEVSIIGWFIIKYLRTLMDLAAHNVHFPKVSKRDYIYNNILLNDSGMTPDDDSEFCASNS